MNGLIEMDRHAARREFLKYRGLIKERHEAEDLEIMRGYRQLAMGRNLIHMTEAIRGGGFDNRGLPRLALARATDERVFVETRNVGAGQERITFAPMRVSSIRASAGRGAGVTRFIAPLQEITVPAWDDWQAIVPLVPLPLRPKTLNNYFVLFEATWFRQRARIKGDPYLVKHLGGDLWAVVAAWDLTPLERAVLVNR